MHDEAWIPDDAITQRGAFTRDQARARGATTGEIRWRVSRGVWVPVVGRALRHTHDELDAVTLLHAAHLTWPDGVVVLGAAARIHELPVPDDGYVDVVVPTGRRAQRGLRPHRYRLDPGDVTEAFGVPVTTRRRTILDCLGRLPPAVSLDLLAWVSSRHLLPAEQIASWVAAHPWRWGNQARLGAARRLAAGAVNPAEDLLHQILRRAGITGWLPGAALHEHAGVWANADVYFPELRLVIEVDGRRAHGEGRFQSDRTRQNRLIEAGCTVLRYTWPDLVERPTEVARQIRAMIDRLSPRTPTSARLRA